MTRTAPGLGTILNALRTSRGWTLAKMSEELGLSLSTLSKVERGQLTLNYDKLQVIAQRLDIPLSELFSLPDDTKPGRAGGLTRRSLSSMESAMVVKTDKYDYYYLCCDLRKKLMIPMITQVKARSMEEFGEFLVHDGEEFIYIIEGAVEIRTEYYTPVVIRKGESCYIDSSMGHAYLLAEGCDEASLLGICASATDDLEKMVPEGDSRTD